MEPRGELREDTRAGLQTLQLVSAMRGLAGGTGRELRISDFTLASVLEGRPAMTPEQAAALHERMAIEHNSKPVRTEP